MRANLFFVSFYIDTCVISLDRIGFKIGFHPNCELYPNCNISQKPSQGGLAQQKSLMIETAVKSVYNNRHPKSMNEYVLIDAFSGLKIVKIELFVFEVTVSLHLKDDIYIFLLGIIRIM